MFNHGRRGLDDNPLRTGTPERRKGKVDKVSKAEKNLPDKIPPCFTPQRAKNTVVEHILIRLENSWIISSLIKHFGISRFKN